MNDTELPSKVNMHDIYSTLLSWDDEILEVLVVDKLFDPDAKIEFHLNQSGTYIVYLKNAPDMVETLVKSLEDPREKFWVIPEAGEFRHDKTGEQIGRLVSFALDLSEILEVDCPQVMFTKTEHQGLSDDGALLRIPEKLPDDTALFHVASCMREV